MIPPPDLAARIQQLIDALNPQTLGEWVIRFAKEQHNALPICGNWIFMWALRPDGTVLCIDHEAFSRHTEPETDPLKIYAVLVQATRQHPELAALVPARPLNAQPCITCGATGTRNEQDGSSTSCSTCFGLGWYERVGP